MTAAFWEGENMKQCHRKGAVCTCKPDMLLEALSLCAHLCTLSSTGDEVQPICLPHRDEDFEAGTLCVTSGWGKVSEGE